MCYFKPIQILSALTITDLISDLLYIHRRKTENHSWIKREEEKQSGLNFSALTTALQKQRKTVKASSAARRLKHPSKALCCFPVILIFTACCRNSKADENILWKSIFLKPKESRGNWAAAWWGKSRRVDGWWRRCVCADRCFIQTRPQIRGSQVLTDVI